MRIHKIFFLAIVLVSSIANASISLGTIQTENSATVYPGETAEFKILLFKTGSPVHVNFRYEIPDKWEINIDPEELDVPSESNEYFVIREEYIMASPVYIRFSASENAVSGDYTARIIAQINSNGNGLSVSQDGDFNFKLSLVGGQTTTTISETTITTTTTVPEKPPVEQYNETDTRIEEPVEPEEKSDIFVLIIIIAIIAISVLIYIR